MKMMVIYNFALVLLKCAPTIIMYARGRWLGSEEWSPLSQDLLHWPHLRSSHWRRQRATAAIPPAMTSVRDLIVAFHHIRKLRYKKNWKAAFPPLSCELNSCYNHVLFPFRSIRRARWPTGVYSESHSHYQQTLCSSLLYREEVHVEIHMICIKNVVYF